jgi:hypothetical protein
VKGCPFLVNRKQGAVLQVLIDAYLEGCPCVKEDFLLRAARLAGSDAIRLREVFRGTQLWGKMIVVGHELGTYRLPEVPDEGGE